MSGFYATVICDSITERGERITTMELCYPRFIHSEFMTHRVFSRNAASSRAIPIAKMIEQVRTNPAGPVWWGKNQPGMQAREELDDVHKPLAQMVWRHAAEAAVEYAKDMERLGVHKQIVNRLLEPWMWMKTIVTATEWQNFFDLRCHPDAQPEFQHLAHMVREAYYNHRPSELSEGQWHLPYFTLPITTPADLEVAIKCSVARCARVSYLTHDGQQPDIRKDIDLHNKLVGSVPKHASPAEHQATPALLKWNWRPVTGKDSYRLAFLQGNFTGWYQYRQFLDNGMTVK